MHDLSVARNGRRTLRVRNDNQQIRVSTSACGWLKSKPWVIGNVGCVYELGSKIGCFLVRTKNGSAPSLNLFEVDVFAFVFGEYLAARGSLFLSFVVGVARAGAIR